MEERQRSGLVDRKTGIREEKVPENELDSIASLIDPGRDGKTILLTGSLERKSAVFARLFQQSFRRKE